MKARYRRMIDTRKVYAFEGELPARDTPIRRLRALIRRIWRENTGRRDTCPVVLAGRGTPFGGQLASYCHGRARIVLARHHRSRVVAIHEVVHALGPVTHGRRFQNRYADLLARYL